MGFVAERVKTMTCPECGHEFDPNAVKPLAMIPCPKCAKSVRAPARFAKFLLR